VIKNFEEKLKEMESAASDATQNASSVRGRFREIHVRHNSVCSQFPCSKMEIGAYMQQIHNLDVYSKQLENFCSQLQTAYETPCACCGHTRTANVESSQME
jgi:hypothetical protein